MTVERDGQGGSDRRDPLMAVITGEPLPEAARADAALLAEYRSAEADVAVLREQLGIIGEALTEVAEVPEGPEKAPAPSVRVRPHRRRPFALALGAVGVAAAGAVVVGLGWLLVQAGGGAAKTSGVGADSAQSDSSSKGAGPLGSPEYLACARLVAEGKVTDTRPVPGTGEERVTLDVTRSYKPADGDAEVTFAIPTSAGLDEGDRALVVIRRGSASPDFWLVGEAAIAGQRPLLTETLPQAGTTPCG
ncbi:hypothetical protein ACIHCM_32125 [Streptomyces sp. NPDC052023]|uniref:hypothetical protein n=1 Tax=Streptomyces sp. NPDC052023 TaxID=3365681 RepID=UPI0037D0ECC9